MTVIGRFYVAQADVSSSDPYGFTSVTVTLQSHGPIDVTLLRDLVGELLEVRSTDWGIRARGVKP